MNSLNEIQRLQGMLNKYSNSFSFERSKYITLPQQTIDLQITIKSILNNNPLYYPVMGHMTSIDYRLYLPADKNVNDMYTCFASDNEPMVVLFVQKGEKNNNLWTTKFPKGTKGKDIAITLLQIEDTLLGHFMIGNKLIIY